MRDGRGALSEARPGGRRARLAVEALLLGALVGATIVEPVAGGGVAGAGRNEPQEPPVATWRDGRLERRDYESWLAFHGLEDSPEAVREMVWVVSLAAVSRERGLEREPRAAIELEAMRQSVLVPALRRQVVAGVTVDESEVERLLDEHPDAFSRPRKLRLSNLHKRLRDGDAEATRERMEELRQRLLQGADFAELAGQESESQTRFRGGDLGFVDPDELPPEVAAAVRDLGPGEISPVVEHGDGLTLFLCREVREATLPTRQEAAERLRRNLLRQRGLETWHAYEEALLAEAGPRIAIDGSAASLEMQGYRLAPEEIAILLELRRARQPSEVSSERLEEVLREWALAVAAERRATRLGLDRDPELAVALHWRAEAILARRELVRWVDARLQEPSEEELRRRFEADRERYRRPARWELGVLQFASAPEPAGVGADRTLARDEDGELPVALANSVFDRLEAGEIGFEEAARRYSSHPSAAGGGKIGWRTRRQIAAWGAVASRAIRALAPGEQTGILRLDAGLFVFRLYDREDERPMTFDEAESGLRSDERQQRIRQLEDRLKQEHLEGLGLVVRSRTDSPVGPGLPVPGA